MERELFLNLKIGEKQEEVWVKRLRNILQSDIHEKPLGCKISDTHVEVGEVHLGDFFEAQILFSHSYWIQRFAYWLFQKISNDNALERYKKEIILIGYETYFEPVLYTLKKKLLDNSFKVHERYFIYETPKYLDAGRRSADNLRYVSEEFLDQCLPIKSIITYLFQTQINEIINAHKVAQGIAKIIICSIVKKYSIVSLCGISSTLKTFFKMYNKLFDELSKRLDVKLQKELEDNEQKRYWRAEIYELLPDKLGEVFLDASVHHNNYSIIQVLPDIDNISEDNVTWKTNTQEGLFEFSNNDILMWNEKEKFAKRKKTKTVEYSLKDKIKESTIKVPYLVDVKCVWHLGKNCPWCFPEEPKQERPIIAVSDTSVIPLLMIAHSNNPQREMKENTVAFRDELFRVKKGSFLYKNYLYYNHIHRDEHHYLYYLRTGKLFAALYDKYIKGDKWQRHDSPIYAWTNKIREAIFLKNDDGWENCKENVNVGENKNRSINIIIYPRHFSNGMFPQAINELIFNSEAHMLSLDSNKEYRSNFETKYSNYAYFLEQIKSIQDTAEKTGKMKRTEINFYYVDDQLITGATFLRTKSLLMSLMKSRESVDNPNKNANVKINIFAGIIVFLNRLSYKSKCNYIDEPQEHFFSFIEINIPSIRSYGDSCPMCKTIEDSQKFQKASVLDCVSMHWAAKQYYHRKKTLPEVKNETSKDKENEKRIGELSFEEKQERRFRRFYCENLLWENLSFCQSQKDFEECYANILEEIIYKETKNEHPVEYLISFIKAISRPFIYYKENAKKVTLKFLIGLIEKIINTKNEVLIINTDTLNKKREIKININNSYQKYILVVVLINSLAMIDSTYLLNIERITKLYKYVIMIQKNSKIIIRNKNNKKIVRESFQNGVCCFIDEESEYIMFNDCIVPSFYSVILNAYKRVICGISGKEKCEKFLEDTKGFINNQSKEKYDMKDNNFRGTNEENRLFFPLLKALYIESISEKKNLPNIDNVQRAPSIQSTIRKYNSICKDICIELFKKEIDLSLYYYNQKLNKNALYRIDDSVETKSFSEILFDKENEFNWDANEIKKQIDCNGFIENEGKWLFKLQHYKPSDFIDNEVLDNERYIEEKQIIYLFINLPMDNKNTHEIYCDVRRILQYRYELAKRLREDLDNGAIKSAIQAEGARKLIASDKIFNHGNIDSLEYLYSLADYYLRQEKECHEKAYRIISIYMNRCIGFGGAREILYKYFNHENINEPNAFQAGAGLKKEDDNNDCFAEYIDYITKQDENGKSNFERLYGTARKVELMGFNNGFKERRYPQLTRIPETEDEDSIPYQIILIGIIDIFIKNAIKHGLDNSTIRIIYKKLENNAYTLTIENRLENGSKKECKDESGLNSFFDNRDDRKKEKNKQGVKLTELFFKQHLPRMSSSNAAWGVLLESKEESFQSVFKMEEERNG